MNKKTKRVIKGALLVVVAVFAWTGESLSSGLAAPELAKRQKNFQQALKMNQLDEAEKIVQSLFDAKYDALATKLKIQLLRARIKDEMITSNWLKVQEELLTKDDATIKDVSDRLKLDQSKEEEITVSFSEMVNDTEKNIQSVNKNLSDTDEALQDQLKQLQQTLEQTLKQKENDVQLKNSLEAAISTFNEWIKEAQEKNNLLRNELNEKQAEEAHLKEQSETYKNDNKTLEKQLGQSYIAVFKMDQETKARMASMKALTENFKQQKQDLDSQIQPVRVELDSVNTTINAKQQKLRAQNKRIAEYESKKISQLNDLYSFLVGSEAGQPQVDSIEAEIKSKILQLASSQNNQIKDFTQVNNLLGVIDNKRTSYAKEINDLKSFKEFLIGDNKDLGIKEALINLIGSLYMYSGIPFTWEFGKSMEDQWNAIVANYYFISRDDLMRLSKVSTTSPGEMLTAYLFHEYNPSQSPAKRIKAKEKDIKEIFVEDITKSGLGSIQSAQLFEEPIQRLAEHVAEFLNKSEESEQIKELGQDPSISKKLKAVANYENKIKLALYIRKNRNLVREVLFDLSKELKDFMRGATTVTITYGTFWLIRGRSGYMETVLERTLNSINFIKKISYVEKHFLNLITVLNDVITDVEKQLLIQEYRALIAKYEQDRNLMNDMVRMLDQDLGATIKNNEKVSERWGDFYSSLIKKLEIIK
ncbi:MAG: hypothetical protein WBQ73_02705 [Candidatus Babeliales bacterium]